jgi:hypothetical protein
MAAAVPQSLAKIATAKGVPTISGSADSSAQRDVIDRRPVIDAHTIDPCMRCYISRRRSYRDRVGTIAARGVTVAHMTMLRSVIQKELRRSIARRNPAESRSIEMVPRARFELTSNGSAAGS